MLQNFKGKITWIDLLNPSQDELDHIKNIWKIHPLIIEELKTPSARAKAEIYDNYIFTVLHFPNWNPTDQTSEPYELDVILAKDYIITASYQDVDMREELMERVCSKEFEEKYLDLEGGAVELFYFICHNYLEFAMREVSHIDRKVSVISDQIYKGGENKLIKSIANAKRDILDFRRIYRLLKENLNSLSRVGPRVFGQESQIYFDDLTGDSLKVENIIESYVDTIEALEITNNSLIENRINILTRIYTLLSFVTWPTLLVISSFQMNAKYNPLTGAYQDYFLMLLVAIIPSIFLYIILKKKNIV